MITGFKNDVGDDVGSVLLDKNENLADVSNMVVARLNLGLGSAAIYNLPPGVSLPQSDGESTYVLGTNGAGQMSFVEAVEVDPAVKYVTPPQISIPAGLIPFDGSNVALFASGSHPVHPDANTITYHWEITSGGLDAIIGNNVNASFNILHSMTVQVVSVFALDELGNKSPTVSANLEIASVGMPSGLSISVPSSPLTNSETILVGLTVGSTGGDPNPSYLWETSPDGISWASDGFTNATLEDAAYTPPVDGAIYFRCTVTNITGSTSVQSTSRLVLTYNTDENSNFIDTTPHSLIGDDGAFSLASILQQAGESEFLKAAVEVQFDRMDALPVTEQGGNLVLEGDFSFKSGDTVIIKGVTDVTAKIDGVTEVITPSVDKGFNTVLYIGTQLNQPIEELGFQPDLVWLKDRVSANSHYIYDSIRGVNNILDPSTTAANAASSETLISFDLDGFTLGTNGGGNWSGNNYVAWCWKADKVGISNAIQSEKYNDKTGLSIIKYTADQVAGRVLQHSLNRKPAFAIFKRLDAAENWPVFHKALGAEYELRLDNNLPQGDNVGVWNDTEPTPTEMILGASNAVNSVGGEYIAYIWSEIPGYSAMGSYIGDFNNDGQMFDLGFEPEFVLIKAVDEITSAGEWQLFDNTRGGNHFIEPDNAAAEKGAANQPDFIDFRDNGFKLANNNTNLSVAGKKYMYVAFGKEVNSQSIKSTISVDQALPSNPTAIELLPVQLEMDLTLNPNASIYTEVSKTGADIVLAHDFEEPYAVDEFIYVQDGSTTIKTDITDIVRSISSDTGLGVFEYTAGANFFAGATQLDIVALDSTHVVAAFRDSGQPSKRGTAIAGVISGDTISWGAPIVFSPNHSRSIRIIKLDSSRFCLVCHNYDINERGEAYIGTVVGNTVTFGSMQLIEDLHADQIEVRLLSTDKVLFAINDESGGISCKAIVGTISGNDISIGSDTSFNTGVNNGNRIAVMSPTQVVISNRNEASGELKSYIGTISGNSISLGSAFTLSTELSGSMETVALDSTRFAVIYSDIGSNRFAIVKIGTVAGSNISFGDEYIVASNTNYVNICLVDTDKVALSWADEDYVDASCRFANINGSTLEFGHEFQFKDDGEGYIRNTKIELLEPGKLAIGYMWNLASQYLNVFVTHYNFDQKVSTISTVDTTQAVPTSVTQVIVDETVYTAAKYAPDTELRAVLPVVGDDNIYDTIGDVPETLFDANGTGDLSVYGVIENGGNLEVIELGSAKFQNGAEVKVVGAVAVDTTISGIVNTPEDIPLPAFKTTLYTGTGVAGLNIDGIGFQPDFVWIKRRDNANSPHLVDSVRGISEWLYSTDSVAERTSVDGSVTSFDEDGFTLGYDAGYNVEYNANGASYVAWTWKAGDEIVTNNDGTIASTVSANPDTGFSIITYTGISANATVGHGLGKAPEFIFSKQVNAVNSWHCQHVGSLTPVANLLLNTSVAESAPGAAVVFNSTLPTDSVVHLGTDAGANSGEVIMYAFTSIPGYSSFSSYTGNGNVIGPVVDCGFQPEFVMIKRTDSTGRWIMFDGVRDTLDPNSKVLYADENTDEGDSTTLRIDITETGFEVTGDGAEVNASGGNFIYMAFGNYASMAGTKSVITTTDALPASPSTIQNLPVSFDYFTPFEDNTSYTVIEATGTLEYTGVTAPFIIGEELAIYGDTNIFSVISDIVIDGTKSTITMADSLPTNPVSVKKTTETPLAVTDRVSIVGAVDLISDVTAITKEVVTIDVPNFGTVLYDGNGTSLSITGLGFKPGLVWVKSRSGVAYHCITDTVRGTDSQIFSNSLYAAYTQDYNLTSFDDDGFTVGTAGNVNGLGESFVAWSWKAGDEIVENNDGASSSLVSVNHETGFSIVKYTGAGGIGHTVGHGLGKTPDFIMIKNLNYSTGAFWRNYHKDLDFQGYLGLAESNAQIINASTFNERPDSKVFTLGNDISLNGAGYEHIAYCWSEVPGFSKFGSYTGNGSIDGPVVDCGFKPEFIMVKNITSATTNWHVRDNTRGNDSMLFADEANAESVGHEILFQENGFQIKNVNLATNGSGNEIIYMAFGKTVNTPGTKSIVSVSDDLPVDITTVEELPAAIETITDAAIYSNGLEVEVVGATEVAAVISGITTEVVTVEEAGFKPVAYAGNGLYDHSITGFGFSPNLVWIKNRGYTYARPHYLVDTVRGPFSSVQTDSATAQIITTNGQLVNSFDEDGFTVGNGGEMNGVAGAGEDYIAWGWKAEKPGFGFSDEGLAQNESYNEKTGLSIIKYTGNGVLGRTIKHSLGKAPKFTMIKCLNAARVWSVYHTALGNTDRLILNESYAAVNPSINLWNNTDPSVTEFSLGTDVDMNGNNDEFIAYAWSEIPGYSSFGSYTGNGLVEGPVVDCGFQPEFVMIKRADSAGWWYMLDRTRDAVNPSSLNLYANTTNAEYDGDEHHCRVDWLPTGFQIKADGGECNANAGEFVYMAFGNAVSINKTKSTITVDTDLPYHPRTVNEIPSGLNLFDPKDEPYKVGSKLIVKGDIDIETQITAVTRTTGQALLPAFGIKQYWGNAVQGRDLDDLGFAPDLVLFKNVSSPVGQGWVMFDKIYGPTNAMMPHSTSNINYSTARLVSFDEDGVTIGFGSKINEAGYSHIMYAWKIGGNITVNRDGNILTKVQANDETGMSVVGWTGNGANGATLGHGLSQAPELVLIKKRFVTSDWRVGTTVAPGYEMGPDNMYGELHVLNAFKVGGVTVFGANPTDSVITVGSNTSMNASGAEMGMYCFRSVPGYSKIGSYIGDGSIDGSHHISIGFRPKFIMMKQLNGSNSWIVVDANRYNYKTDKTATSLKLDTGDFEAGNMFTRFTDTGFSFFANDQNYDNQPYLFMAFGEDVSQTVKKSVIEVTDALTNLPDTVSEVGNNKHLVFEDRVLEPYGVGEMISINGDELLNTEIVSVDRVTESEITKVTLDEGSLVTANNKSSNNIMRVDDTTVIVAFNNSSTNFSEAVIGKIQSNGEIIWGDSVSIDGNPASIFYRFAKIDDTHVIIAYSVQGGSTAGKAIIGTISGNTITFGSAASFTTSVSHFDVTLIDATKFVVTFRDEAGGAYNKAIIGTISGVAISFGTSTTCTTASCTYISTIYLGVNKIFTVWREDGDNTYGKCCVGDVSGSTVTFGNIHKYTGLATSTRNWVVKLDSNKVAILNSATGSIGGVVIAEINGNEVTSGPIEHFNDYNMGGTYGVTGRLVAIDSSHIVVTVQESFSDPFKPYTVLGEVNGLSITWKEKVYQDTFLNWGGSDLVNSDQIVVTGTNADSSSLYVYIGRIHRQKKVSTFTMANGLPENVVSATQLPQTIEHVDLTESYVAVDTAIMKVTGIIVPDTGDIAEVKVKSSNSDNNDRTVSRIELDFWNS